MKRLATFTLSVILLALWGYSPNIAAQNSPAPGLHNEVFYYLMVDRFRDGNPDNNIPLYMYPEISEVEFAKNLGKSPDALTRQERIEHERLNQYRAIQRAGLFVTYDHSQSVDQLEKYKGGDIEGVIQKLDYLKNLGVTAIILTPIFRCPNTWDGYHIPYHGYWPTDWFVMEERFSNQKVAGALDPFGHKLFQKLIEEAHKRNLKVVLDIVINHTSPANHNVDHFKAKTNHPFRIYDTKQDKNPDKGQQYDYSIPAMRYMMDFGLITRKGRPIAAYMQYDPNKHKITYTNSHWFHTHHREIQPFDWGDPWKVQNYQLGPALPDLATDHPDVRTYFDDAFKFWLDLGADGFRLDAVKHVSKAFLRHIENTIRTHKPDAILIGEFYDGGITCNQTLNFFKDLPTMTLFDFSLANVARRFFAHTENHWQGPESGRAYNIQGVINRREDFLEDANVNLKDLQQFTAHRDHELITFIDLQDIPRLLMQYNISRDQYLSALKFLFAARGIPMLYYGNEISLQLPRERHYKGVWDNRIGSDPYNRQMMTWRNNDQHPTYQMVQALTRLRLYNSSLRYGETIFVSSPRHYDTIAFVRRESDTHNYAFFYYSPSNRDASFLFGDYGVTFPDGQYTDPTTGILYRVSNNILTIRQRQNNQAVIFTANPSKTPVP